MAAFLKEFEQPDIMAYGADWYKADEVGNL